MSLRVVGLFLALCIGFLLLPVDSAAQFTERQGADTPTPPWENPRVNEIDRRPAHAVTASYPSVTAALAEDDEPTTRERSLNGTWRFSFASNLSEAPRPPFDDGASPTDWDEISVPAPKITNERYSQRGTVDFALMSAEVADAREGRLQVTNRSHFTNLSAYDVTWTLRENAEVIQEGTLSSVDVAPGATETIAVPLERPALAPGAEYHLEVRVRLADDTRWADAGHVLARMQAAVPFDVPAPERPSLDQLAAVTLDDTTDRIEVAGAGFSVAVGRESGAIESLVYDGDEQIESPLTPNYWRAETDNDQANGNGMAHLLRPWETAAEGRTVTAVTAEQTAPQAVQVRVEGTLPVGRSTFTNRYTVYGNGDVHVQHSVTRTGDAPPSIPRVGMQMAVPGAYDEVTWYGRGPHENYWDRKAGARVGQYQRSPSAFVTPYVRPQENANRSGVRWAALTDGEGRGLLVVGDAPLSVSAWPYTQSDLAEATHTHELPDRAQTTLNVDHKQMGLGGNNTWSEKARPLPKYRLSDATYTYGFILRPYTADEESIEAAAQDPVPRVE